MHFIHQTLLLLKYNRNAMRRYSATHSIIKYNYETFLLTKNKEDIKKPQRIVYNVSRKVEVILKKALVKPHLEKRSQS